MNMYLTTTMSVMLVLLLIGMDCVLLLSAGSLVKHVRESVAMDVVLVEDIDSTGLARVDRYLNRVPYSLSYRYISADEALREHISSLGEDPREFLGYNPLNASYEVHLQADYANADSMAVIAERLQNLPQVDRVNYQHAVVDVLNSHMNYVIIFLAAVALILLLIAVALIVNTIRLQIYSKRFLIRTMSLVGATGWHVRKPFVGKNLIVGTVAAVLALVVLTLVIYFVHYKLGLWLFEPTWQNGVILSVVVFSFGILITLVASMTATGRYIRMKTDTLYEI